MSARAIWILIPASLALLQLQPGTRLALGVSGLGVAATATAGGWPDDAQTTAWLLSAVAIVLGAHGMIDRVAAHRRVQAALARWPQLQADYERAMRAGRSPARFLTEQGIRGREVRRYVLRRLRGENPAAPGSAATRTGAEARRERRYKYLDWPPRRP